MAELEIKLIPHTGQQPIYDQGGHLLQTIEVEVKGMQRIMRANENCNGGWEQIGFVHPNNYIHFIEPLPEAYQGIVVAKVESQLGINVPRYGAPPPISAQSENEEE